MLTCTIWSRNVSSGHHRWKCSYAAQAVVGDTQLQALYESQELALHHCCFTIIEFMQSFFFSK